MHKKYYFAGFFILAGCFMGILAVAGLIQTGFSNRGPIPIIAVLGVSGAFMIGGLLFIIFGGNSKK